MKGAFGNEGALRFYRLMLFLVLVLERFFFSCN
jgi:hypothetical protein